MDDEWSEATIEAFLEIGAILTLAVLAIAFLVAY